MILNYVIMVSTHLTCIPIFVYLESHKIGSHKKGSTDEKFMKPCVRESLGCYKQFNNQFWCVLKN